MSGFQVSLPFDQLFFPGREKRYDVDAKKTSAQRSDLGIVGNK